MSDYTGLQMQFELVNPASVRSPEKVLCKGLLTDIYNDTSIIPKTPSASPDYVRPLYLKLRPVAGSFTGMQSCVVTIKFKRRQ